ncbi:MAG: hypothetical protein ACM3IH_14040 [Sphingobacteriales bacterium]
MKKLIWLAGLLLAGCQTVSAAQCIPPARYDHEPKKHYSVRNLSPQDMAALCSGAKGCTIDRVIFLRNDLPPEWRACVLRHEKGHLNGWPGNHPA